ncbi:MAG: rod shape-determining protein MreC [Bacteroidota bacterium]|nr:rod shape-determining protein MreC [Bacteroidota bacterium]
MRNIFLFIRKFSNFLLFLVLQIIALYFLFTYNKFHQAIFMNTAGELTGRVSERYNNVEYYFRLKQTNEALSKQNEHLLNLLRQDYEGADTAARYITDSLKVDSLVKVQRFRYYDAKVVSSFVSMQNNYITIHRGANQGLPRNKEWGVVSPEGIAGRVVSVGDNFSIVMSVLNRQFKVNSMLKKGGETGPVSWDGDNPQYLRLANIPKSAKVAKGDTVLTSNVSDIYPPGIMVGTIAEIVDDKSSNFYILKLKTATNFSALQYVYVLEDLQREEREKLEDPYKKGK